MKFWVKAITDDNVQEQLLVNASNVEELALQLGSLLHTHVTCISVSDFQAQVVEKLSNGADIVTVKVTTSKATCGQQKELDASCAHSETRMLRSTPAPPELSPLSSHTEDDSLVLSQGHSFFEVLQCNKPSTTSQLLLELPQIDRVCLRREDIELLLLPSHGGAYHSVLCGCFVRIRERQDYCLYQIVRSVGSMELLLDMIYCEKIRRTEVVSNTPPLLQEMNAWGKNMLTASRSIVTAGFIEAKMGDVGSALRVARAGADEQPLGHAHVTPAPPTPSADGRESHRRRCRPTVAVLPHTYANILLGRVELKTNDVLQHVQLCLVEEPEHDDFDVVIFASRQTNKGKKMACLSDFSGCMITLGKAGQRSGIVRDRDVTEKGYELFCPPQRWDGHYISVGRIRPAVNEIQHCDDAGNCIGEFMVLSGKFATGLFNRPTVTTLPIPAWAQTDGTVAHIVRPQLVVHREKLHVFYLLRLTGTCSSRRRNATRGPGSGSNAFHAFLRCNISPECKTLADNSTPSTSGISRESSFNGSATMSMSYYGLAHAVSCDDTLHTWQVVTTKEPLFTSFHTMPVFTVASLSQPDPVRDAESIGTTSSSGLTEKVLQLLWYEEDHVLHQSSFSHQRSPCSALSLNTNLSNRVQLPFERWVNYHEAALPENWVRELSYSAIRMNAESVKSGVASLSLYEQDGVLVVACVQIDVQRNASVMMVPLTAEP